MRRVFGFCATLSSVASLIGAWFWWREHRYAADNFSELAATLQWLGVAIFFLGLAGAIGFSVVGIQFDEDPEDPLRRTGSR